MLEFRLDVAALVRTVTERQSSGMRNSGAAMPNVFSQNSRVIGPPACLSVD